MAPEDKQDGREGVVESKCCVASSGGYCRDAFHSSEGNAGVDLTGDLELEGRDMDGRVGTWPDGILHVPSACSG